MREFRTSGSVGGRRGDPSVYPTSTATFKLIAGGSQFTEHGSSDSWAAFPEAQTAFREAIVAHDIEGVILLSGDIHATELRFLPGADGGYSLPELTSSPLANTNFSCGSDDELIACFDSDDYFIGLEIDTTRTDPSVEATVCDGSGAPLASWEILPSELEI
jgi:alkaline phosphatase D